jgi:hypothetical protein
VQHRIGSQLTCAGWCCLGLDRPVWSRRGEPSGVVNKHVCIYVSACSSGGHGSCMPAVVGLSRGRPVCIACMLCLWWWLQGVRTWGWQILTGGAVCTAYSVDRWTAMSKLACVRCCTGGTGGQVILACEWRPPPCNNSLIIIIIIIEQGVKLLGSFVRPLGSC